MEKYTREELEGMAVRKGLIPIATELNIVGRHDMRKEELIASILEVYGKQEQQEQPKKEKKKNNFEPVLQRVKMGKLSLKGVLVAYYHDGKLTTGKILSSTISMLDGDFVEFKIENITRVKHHVKKKDIQWIKLGKRWPKFIYDELKNKNHTEV